MERVRYGAAAILRKCTELQHRAPHCLPLLRRKMLHHFGALDHVLPLGGRHVIELRQAVTHPLLHLRRQLAEPRFTLERSLLLREGECPMAIHPLGQMLLILVWPDAHLRRLARVAML
jgi:hypothetical protein